MPRSAIVYRANPEASSDLMDILFSKGKEFFYDESEKYAIYIKDVRSIDDNIRIVDLLVDHSIPLLVKKRNGDRIETEQQMIRTVSDARLGVIKRVGENSLDNVVLSLSNKRIAKIIATALEGIIGKTALLRVRFAFPYSIQSEIVNLFEDIVRITSEDVDDMNIAGLSLKGHSLYNAGEFDKAFTGKVKYIGVRLGNEWFLISTEGRITTYKNIDDRTFIEKIYTILHRLLGVGAIII